MNKPIIDLSGAKILTVDDVPANLDVLSQSLESDGYNVLVATSGETAIQVAKQTSPDLILLDVMMPGIDGFETCRRLKADPDTAGSPVIFLTARNELEGVLEGFQAGVWTTFPNPSKRKKS
jgi:CheY-like chemotaxis protein